jgi:hypothetical protein
MHFYLIYILLLRHPSCLKETFGFFEELLKGHFWDFGLLVGGELGGGCVI